VKIETERVSPYVDESKMETEKLLFKVHESDAQTQKVFLVTKKASSFAAVPFLKAVVSSP